MQRVEPAALATFLAIAKRRSFRRAAADLGVTPSALSHSLRTLEAQLGVRLLNRTTRSVGLTEAGERLLSRVGPAFRDIDDALEELARLVRRMHDAQNGFADPGGWVEAVAGPVVCFRDFFPPNVIFRDGRPRRMSSAQITQSGR